MSTGKTLLSMIRKIPLWIRKPAGIIAGLLFIGVVATLLPAAMILTDASVSELKRHAQLTLGLLAAGTVMLFAAVYFLCRSFGLKRGTSTVIMLALFGLLTLVMSEHIPEPLMNLVMDPAQPVEFKL